ncbi:unnamed protein product [Polarella glacialis]|uniref:PLD phosphodiesterase domain-containing protein n=1 Tax=Polarella glacialis TaxID=89957 RepID=A0A813HUG8_POLGL|nr:unnamed protein product [Polarella glacialis]CAE8739456.1 unnamed protein product [Polarella glacialis]
MCDIIVRAERWVDITSLSTPTGKFLDCLGKAFKQLHDTGRPVTIRAFFGNIIGNPTNVYEVMNALKKELPEDTALKIWVGSLRVGLSAQATWNHSKIIAVDGQYILQGGHNMWDAHYLQKNPVRDVSVELEGPVAHDGHIFANWMWQVMSSMDVSLILDDSSLPTMTVCEGQPTRVQLNRFPDSIERQAPQYEAKVGVAAVGVAKIISLGRYGNLQIGSAPANPSDAGLEAMMASARKSIRISQQDLGPLAVPIKFVTVPLPGTVWPTKYFQAIGGALCRGVDVHIMVSNPHSVPGGVKMANYGNGWTCEDVGGMLVKVAMESNPQVPVEEMSRLVSSHLKISYIRSSSKSRDWPDGEHVGNHSKVIIVDEIAHYIGSQNLYIANLCEWGLIFDDADQTAKFMDSYWNPMWQQTLNAKDCLANEVMERALSEWPQYDDSSVEARTLAAAHSLKQICLDAGSVDIKEAKEYLETLGYGVDMEVKGLLDAMEEFHDLDKKKSGHGGDPCCCAVQ